MRLVRIPNRPRRVSRPRLLGAVIIVLAQLVPAVPAVSVVTGVPVVSARTQSDHKHVLVLYSTRRDAEFSIVGESALPRLLELALDRNIDYNSEFIDVTRFSDEAYQVAFRDFLRLKYQNIRFDVVVVLQDPAVGFITRFRESLFPETPVVLLTNTPATTRLPNSTGLLHERDFTGTVTLIHRLQPEARRLFVVTGAAPADKAFESAVRRQLKVERVLTVEYLSGLPTKTLEQRLARLPANSAVYYVLVTEDGDGNRFHPLEYIDRVAAAANAPTYCWVDAAMNHGIVGGRLYNQRRSIERVGELALRVLRGEPADGIPIAPLIAYSNQVDWRQLRRWGIDEARVPLGTVVSYRDPTIWDRYRHYIVIAAALLITQTGLIAGLLIQRQRRRRAEDDLRVKQGELRRSYQRNRHLAARLLKAQETERSRIARELHDDICQRMLLLTIELEALGRGASDGPSTDGPTGGSNGGSSDGSNGQSVTDALTAAQDISKSLHELSHRLHPTRLRMIGLAAALDRLCGETSRAGIAIDYQHENVPSPLPPDLMLCLFRIVQEALQNAIKYSAAKEVHVRLTGGEAGLTLSVVDDGAGFDVEEAWGRGVGLVSMVERLEAIGGLLDVWSHPGAGSRLTATVPAHVLQKTITAYDSTRSPH